MPINQALQNKLVHHCIASDSGSLRVIQEMLDKHLESGEISLTKSNNEIGEEHYHTPIEAVFVAMTRSSISSREVLTEEKIQKDKEYYEERRLDVPEDPKGDHEKSIAEDKESYARAMEECKLLLRAGENSDEFIDDVLKKLETIKDWQALDDAVKMLIDKFGVDRLEKNVDGSQRKLPLFIAAARCKCMRKVTIDLLSSKNADHTLRDLSNGKSIAHYAIHHYGAGDGFKVASWKFNKDNIKSLAGLGVINTMDEDGFTPLHRVAAKYTNQIENFKFMLELGADPDARQSGKRFGSKPIDAITGYDSEDTKGLKEEIRKVIKEHKAAEAEAEKKAAETEKKNEKSEGGEMPKKKGFSVSGAVRRAADWVHGKRGYQPVHETEDDSAGAAAGLPDGVDVTAAGSKGVDGHDEGSPRAGAGVGVSTPNPEFQPTSKPTETTGLLSAHTGNKKYCP